MNKTLISLAVSAALLSGCVATGTGPGASKQDVGTVIGGFVGVLAGQKLGGTQAQKNVLSLIMGGAGAAIGNQIGKNWDEADRQKVMAAQLSVLQSTAPITVSRVDAQNSAGYVQGIRSETYLTKTGDAVTYTEVTATGQPLPVVVAVAPKAPVVAPQPAAPKAPVKAPATKTKTKAAPVKEAKAAPAAAPAAPAKGGVIDMDAPVASASNVGAAPGMIKVAYSPTSQPTQLASAAATAGGDCKFVQQKITTPDGQSHVTASKFCKGAGGDWAAI